MAAQDVDFNRDIRPILSDKCYTCHGPSSVDRKTQLRFDIESGARIDLSGGRKAIAPGDPEHSELFKRLSSDNTAVRMPPAAINSAPGKSIPSAAGSSKAPNGSSCGPSFRPSAPSARPSAIHAGRSTTSTGLSSRASIAKACTLRPKPIAAH